MSNLVSINSNQSLRLIRRKEVQSKTGLGASSIYALMLHGEFPKAVNLSERRVAWIESEVDQWVLDKINAHKASLNNEGADVE